MQSALPQTTENKYKQASQKTKKRVHLKQDSRQLVNLQGEGGGHYQKMDRG